MYRAWVLRAVIAPSWEYSGGDLGHAPKTSRRDGLTATVGRTADDDDVRPTTRRAYPNALM